MAIARSSILLWSSLSGLLWMLAWPAIGGWAAVAFIAWLPLLHGERLHAIRTREKPRSFLPYVLSAVLIWNAGCSWWFFMVSEPLSTRIASVTVPVVVNTLLMTLPWWLARITLRSMGARIAGIAFILFWLAFERLHHNWDMQWPWFSIGNVFGTSPALVQWYEFTGMLGGSLWVLMVNLMLDRLIAHKLSGSPYRGSAIAAVSVLVVPMLFSLYLWNVHEEEGELVEVVVVQPNVDPYHEKFGGVDALEQLERMLALAEGVLTDGTRAVVLPETALQEATYVSGTPDDPDMVGLWENDLEGSRSVHRMRVFQRQHPDVALLSGMSSNRLYRPNEPHPLSARRLGPGPLYYEASNAAVFLPSEGPLQQYRKSKLVAGVELMPFEEYLGPLGHLAIDLGGTTGSLAQQEERSVLSDVGSGMSIVPAICYESVFGEHVAAHVRNGGNVIAIMTNDGWWDDSPGHLQHLAFAPLRAIETRRSVVRSANTGISCIVDQRGGIHNATSWWKEDAFVGTVRLSDRITFFVRHGDLVGRIAVTSSLLMLLVLVVRRFMSAGRTDA